MQKLVFDYTYCDYPESFEWNKPFLYESKEKFILDALNNPKILDSLGIVKIYDYEIEENTIFESEYIKNIHLYVFSLDEWFDKNIIK
jgi:hypothetical protein